MDIMNNTNNTTAIENDGCSLTAEEIKHSYNLALHIGSIFVLLVVSFIGAFISVASTRFKRLHINPIIINTGKFFGSGVVLATGFIHILPDAMATLSDPCLPDSWNAFGAYGGLFAMLAALGMQLIEFLAHQQYRSMQLKHTHITAHIDVKEYTKNEHAHDKGDEYVNKEKTNYETNESVSVEHVNHENEKPKKKKRMNNKTDGVENIEQTNDKTEQAENVEQAIDTNAASKKKTLVNGEIDNVENPKQVTITIEEPEQTQQTSERTGKSKKKKKHTHSKNDTSEHIEEIHHHTQVPETKDHNDSLAIEILQIDPLPTSVELCEGSGHYHGAAFQDNSHENKISTYLLELGIALHSVLIGLTLGTTTESFVALFIALCFHQFFEAIALGAQIAHLKTTSIKTAIYMVVFFSLTTPVGIAIGIGIHSGTYNPKSVSSLLVTGILDSLSAGVLIYVALVNLITAEMGINAHTFYSLSTRLKFLYFIALYLGVAAMTVIGRWA